MKNQITVLDDYLSSAAKALSGILMIWLFSGSMNIFRSPLFLKDLTTGSLCLLGLIFIGTLLFSKRVLLMESEQIFQGLLFRDKIIFKKEIDLQNIKSVNVYDNRNQLVIPWWISMTANLLTDEKAFKFKLETTSGKEKYLISFKSIDSKNSAVGFFKSCTELEIKECE